MTTASRTEMNRANAQHSTGPKTDAGKQRSSLNSLRHGLTGQVVVMPNEDLAAYQRRLTAYTDEFHPQGAVEEDLVQALADTAWRLNRVAALETNLLTLGMTNSTLRVEASEQIQDAMSIVAALESQSKALSNLSLHSQRLSRQFERTVAQLRDLQTIRRNQEMHELSDVVAIIEMYKSTEKTYDPSEHGFVFSEQQITDAVRLRNRENLVAEAYDHRDQEAA